ncbi:MAG: short chain dehydrogenase family protein [Bradyrhizobium sp.]|nr:short chain dehydrogenase family protein [Bradyrhizobium sp.]
MTGRFEGKTAIVTGAGRGIGRETAILLAREGASVVVNDLGGGPQGLGGDNSIAQTVVDEIRETGGTAVAETSSVSTMAGGKALVEMAMDSFGRLDFLINNAGIIRPKRITDMTEEDFDLVLAVNLKGYFATVRHAAEHLKKRGGAIVNLSSPSGFGHLGMSNYSAAKEGVVGFSRSIARELGEFGVRCNVIRPVSGNSAMQIPEVYETITYSIEKLHIPYISNQWLSSGGIDGLPQHVAAVAAWLCTDEAAPLSGREIYINGAQLALVQEPELIRTQCNPAGWDLESLCAPGATAHLTYDQRNRYTGKA